DPRTKQTSVLLRDLWFANGVALSAEEDYVLVCETYRYQIVRYWLQGPKAGTSDLFIGDLPGFPDNLSRGDWGLYWVALFTVRNPEADWLQPRPFAKKVLSRLPRAFWPKPEPFGLVLGITPNANLLPTFPHPPPHRLPPLLTPR